MYLGNSDSLSGEGCSSPMTQSEEIANERENEPLCGVKNHRCVSKRGEPDEVSV